MTLLSTLWRRPGRRCFPHQTPDLHHSVRSKLHVWDRTSGRAFATSMTNRHLCDSQRPGSDQSCSKLHTRQQMVMAHLSWALPEYIDPYGASFRCRSNHHPCTLHPARCRGQIRTAPRQQRPCWSCWQHHAWAAPGASHLHHHRQLRPQLPQQPSPSQQPQPWPASQQPSWP